MKALAAEFCRARGYFAGDFYPLTPYSIADDVWMAYQLHRPEKNAGMVLVFRRTKCATSVLRLPLRSVDTNAHYELRFSDEHLQRSTKAFHDGELLNGIEVMIEHVPGSLLIEFRRR